jgi:hypothetical protein
MMSLSPADLRKLKNAFNDAAESSPNADVPVISFGGKALTARDVAKEVENETPIGKMLISAVDQAVSGGAATLDQVIQQLTRKPPRP